MAEVFVFVAWSFLHCSLAPRNAVVSVTEATVVCEHVNIIIMYTYLFLACNASHSTCALSGSAHRTMTSRRVEYTRNPKSKS